MYYQNMVGACFMYCKEIVDQIGEYDPTMFLVEDYEYWLRILVEYGEIGYLEENIYLYRIHEGSLTAKREKSKNTIENKVNQIYEIEGNDASTSLQAKLGLVPGKRTIYWKL